MGAVKGLDRHLAIGELSLDGAIRPVRGVPAPFGSRLVEEVDPSALVIQDGPEPHDYLAREVTGDEKAVWWERAVAEYASYADYQAATTRVIPVLVARRVDE